MTNEAPKEPSRLVVNQSEQPCGCVMTEYSDGARVLAPCVPCGLNAAAQTMAQAGQLMMRTADALGAVAHTKKTTRLGIVR